jgi:hypothetical protein
MRSKWSTTALVLNGVPSWNSMPSRAVSVHAV